MDTIRIFIDNLIELTGITGSTVPIVRHTLLVVVTMLLAWLAFIICHRVLVPFILKVTNKTAAVWDDILFNRTVLLSACRIVPAIVVWQLLPLIFHQFPLVHEALTRLTSIYIVVMSVRLAVVFIDSFRYIEPRIGSSSQQYIQSFCGVLKIVAIFIGVIITLSVIINRSPLTLFAGLGATSAVLMLVFKDTIEGLVAGIRLTSNEMVHKGDWITVQGTAIDGVVQEISLTTVKVQNFDNTILTVSPLTLVNGSFQNWKGMTQGDGRRVNRNFYLDFRSIVVADEALKRRLSEQGLCTEEELKGNPVNLRLYRNYMECYLRNRPEVNSDMTILVRQQEATDHGLPINFYFFLRNKEWENYEHTMSDLMEHAYAVAPLFGLRIYQKYPVQ